MQLHVVVHIFMSCKEKWNWIRHEDGHPLMQGLNRMKRMRVKSVSRFLQLLGCSQLPAGVGVRAISRGFSAMRNDGDFAEASPSRSFQVVVAATRELGIGKNGRLPWKLPSDMKFFKEITSTTTTACKRNAVIMGRKTWESIPPMFRPLPGRLNVVLTRSDIPIADNQKDNVLVCGGLHSALGLLAAPPYALSIETVFVIGGAQIYGEAVNLPSCLAIHITEIENSFECDTFIPPIDIQVYRPWYSSFPKVENDIRYSIVTYIRCEPPSIVDSSMTANEFENGSKQIDGHDVSTIQKYQFLPKYIFESHEEYQYLKLIQNIILDGIEKRDQNGTEYIFYCPSIKSVNATMKGRVSSENPISGLTLNVEFARAYDGYCLQMRFNLRKSFPLLTTKQVFWQGVVEELLCFIHDSTNAKVLQEKGIHIWNGNTARECLDSIVLKEREEEDMGPLYGFQWKHFGTKYTDMHAAYSGRGFDQLADMIHKIKSNPEGQCLMLSSWNPADLKLMALPPCCMFAQFYIANGELSCQMYQRSCDMCLEVPFSIASYALLTCWIAHVCDLVPGDFVHVLGDVHVYKKHVVPLLVQLKNVPRPFPVLKINPEKMDVDSFVASDFCIIGYEYHKKPEMEMAVEIPDRRTLSPQ